MAINISRVDVKRKCMIPVSDTAYDSQIDSLISEMKPGIEYDIAEVYLNNTSNTALQATLALGTLEIISGEFLEQLSREPGAMEQFSIAGVNIGERREKGQLLKTQGQARLAPYQKGNQPMMSETGILSTTKETEPNFSLDETVW
jgi:hypothetical protein